MQVALLSHSLALHQMLTVLSEVALKRATNHELGNVQLFLERLLVEVVSENYRYFLSEHMSYRHRVKQDANTRCWPPLLANERQVSGAVCRWTL